MALKARRKRIYVRCIVIVNDFCAWVIASSIRIDFFIDGFHVYTRHQCLSSERMLDKPYLLASNYAVINRIAICCTRIVVYRVVPILFSIPNDLRIAIRYIAFCSITSKSCDYLVVLWSPRVVLETNTLTKLKYERCTRLVAFGIHIIDFLRGQTIRDKETLTFRVIFLTFAYLRNDKWYFPRIIRIFHCIAYEFLIKRHYLGQLVSLVLCQRR